jgi:hypothetical protein
MNARFIGQGAFRPGAWRVAAWSAAGLVLLAPLIAMGFTDEVAWTGGDFAAAALLLAGGGAVVEAAAWRSKAPMFRAGAVLAAAAGLLVVWTSGAVGLIGDGRGGLEAGFLAAPAAALIGAFAAGPNAAALSRAMAGAAAVQLAGGAAALLLQRGGAAEALTTALASAAFGAMWAASALCFLRAKAEPAAR